MSVEIGSYIDLWYEIIFQIIFQVCVELFRSQTHINNISTVIISISPRRDNNFYLQALRLHEMKKKL